MQFVEFEAETSKKDFFKKHFGEWKIRKGLKTWEKRRLVSNRKNFKIWTTFYFL